MHEITAFPIGAIVRAKTKSPRHSSDIDSGNFFDKTELIVIGDAFERAVDPELIDGKEVAHPNWTCIPVVEMRRISRAREYFRDSFDSDSDVYARFWGHRADVLLADVEDLELAAVGS
jgi:hypothetical protein